MSLGKQAKPLAKGQIDAVISHLAKTRHLIRNRLIFLLSIRARLRAREIALLTWGMVTDAEGKIRAQVRHRVKSEKGQQRTSPNSRILFASLV